jgi:hypothetical protein
MKTHLVVTREFGPHAKGAIVADPKIIESILASDHAGHVVHVRTPNTAPKAISSKKDA